MLTKFSVSNFKGFNDEFVLDLKIANKYTFNEKSVSNGIVKNLILYGKNGVGKSNLGLAIFDIIIHLTDDKERGENDYTKYYQNALNKSGVTTFYYEFIINSKKIIYEYQKSDCRTIQHERFTIEGKIIAEINRKKSNNAFISLTGAESLNKNIENTNLSILKYLKNNLPSSSADPYSSAFSEFFNFIDGMLFFKSLDQILYRGFESGVTDIQEDIIKRENVSDLQSFLNNAGIDCVLKVINETGRKRIAFDFDGDTIPIYEVASQGTKALILFYFWLQRIRLADNSGVKFLFIDEFDAFYHHELSRLIVEELKKIDVQFVLTTHNTSIMTNDLLRPDCYFIMNKNTSKSLSKCTPKELREAHNLEKMYKSGSFYV